VCVFRAPLIKITQYFNAVQFFKQYLCNKPDLFYENYALASHTFAFLFFQLQYTKAADGKLAVVTVDTVEEKGNQYNRHY
jgi:hypothetical protein